MSVFKRCVGPVLAAITLSGCFATSIQGYADRTPPAKPISRIAAIVTGPDPLVASIQASIGEEAKKRGLTAENALLLVPPTRTYSDAEIKQAFAADGVDGLLMIKVGNAVAPKQYSGTMMNIVGDIVAPVYRGRRRTSFVAQMIEPATGRNLWVGNGQDAAAGLALVGNDVSAGNAVSAIFEDLQAKGVIARSNS